MANTSAGPIEYADDGAGTPLLSIHGAGGGYDQGLANVADLLGDDFRVIAPSRFGYLGTPIPSDTSSASQADAHAALLTELMPRVDNIGPHILCAQLADSEHTLDRLSGSLDAGQEFGLRRASEQEAEIIAEQPETAFTAMINATTMAAMGSPSGNPQ